MNQHLKALGLLLVAALGLTAVNASAASAAPAFTAPEAGAEDLVTIEMDQKSTHVFSFSGGTITCTSISFHGEQFGPLASSITISPTYSGCTAFGLSATVIMNGCAYILHANGTMDVECSGNNEITMTAGGGACVTHIPAQAGLGTITYTTGESAGKHDLTAHFDIAGITGNTTSGFFCAATGGHFSNGTLTGESTMTAASEGAPVGIELHQGDFHTEAKDAIIIGQGTGIDEFSVDAGTAECSESGYRGTMTSKTAAELALEPEFASCEAFGFSNATVEGNDCAYVLAVDSEGEGGSFEGSLDIECPEGKAIEIVGKVRGLIKCTVKIGSQSGLEGVGYANEGSGSSRDVLIDLDLSGVSYTQHAGEGLEKCDGGSFADGEIRAAPTTIAEDAEKAQLGLWVE